VGHVPAPTPATRGVVVAPGTAAVYPRGRSITVRFRTRCRSRGIPRIASFVDPPNPHRLARGVTRRDAGGFPVSAVPNSVSSEWRTQTPVVEALQLCFARPKSSSRVSGGNYAGSRSEASGSPLIRLEAWIGQEGHV